MVSSTVVACYRPILHLCKFIIRDRRYSTDDFDRCSSRWHSSKTNKQTSWLYKLTAQRSVDNRFAVICFRSKQTFKKVWQSDRRSWLYASPLAVLPTQAVSSARDRMPNRMPNATPNCRFASARCGQIHLRTNTQISFVWYMYVRQCNHITYSINHCS